MPNGAVEVATAIAAVSGRTRDFADIESLARYGREPIDRDFVARHVREILHPDDAERRLEALTACLGGANPAAPR